MTLDLLRWTPEEHMLVVLYVMGPMTGLPDSNRPAFRAAADQLRDAGYIVRSPIEACPDCTDWTVGMRVALRQLTLSTAVAALDGWTRSQGARLEALVAMRLGMPVRPVEWWLQEAQL